MHFEWKSFLFLCSFLSMYVFLCCLLRYFSVSLLMFRSDAVKSRLCFIHRAYNFRFSITFSVNPPPLHLIARRNSLCASFEMRQCIFLIPHSTWLLVVHWIFSSLNLSFFNVIQRLLCSQKVFSQITKRFVLPWQKCDCKRRTYAFRVSSVFCENKRFCLGFCCRFNFEWIKFSKQLHIVSIVSPHTNWR